MAFQIVWTKQAAKDYDKIVKYLEENWTEIELVNFITETDRFFQTLSQHPEILQKTRPRKTYIVAQSTG